MLVLSIMVMTISSLTRIAVYTGTLCVVRYGINEDEKVLLFASNDFKRKGLGVPASALYRFLRSEKNAGTLDGRWKG